MSKELLSLIEKLRASKYIKEKKFEKYPGVSAFNFTRDAFYDGIWNDETIKARGLFIDTETGEVVARGYNKFFNIGERPETQPNEILKEFQASLDAPIHVSLKENGYLGIVGIYRGTLFTASKSTPEGDFADNFREILGEILSERLFNALKDGYCATFEVIDPVNDPHIIEEKEPRIVLLDVFERRLDKMVKLNTEELHAFAEKHDLPHVKKTLFTFTSQDQFKNWMTEFTTAEKNGDVSYGLYDNKQVEGVVIEDNHLHMTKAKFPFYTHWKWARSTLDTWQRIQEMEDGRGKTEKLKNFSNRVAQHHSPLVHDFGTWLLSLDGDEKQHVIDHGKQIVEARKIYLASEKLSPKQDTEVTSTKKMKLK